MQIDSAFLGTQSFRDSSLYYYVDVSPLRQARSGCRAKTRMVHFFEKPYRLLHALRGRHPDLLI